MAAGAPHNVRLVCLCTEAAGSPSQTTSPGRTGCDQLVRVTYPIHPLRGQQLQVVVHVRTHDGQRFVDVQHPLGGAIRLPVDWTDLGASLMPPVIEGREVKLAIEVLLELAAAVATCGGS